MNSIFLGEPPEYIKEFLMNGGQSEDPNLKIPLTFTAEEANSTVKLTKQGTTAIEGFNGLEYKLNDGDWTDYTIGSDLTLTNVGDKVQIRAVADGNSRMGMNGSNYHQFVMTGKIAASGNVNTLLNQDPTAEVSLEEKDYCYYRMFYRCTSLTQAPALPATTLAAYCYYQMFYYCTSLKSAPDLPAETLATYCYNYMFAYCSSLKSAPELPATTLATYCYNYMFAYCSSLKSAPDLPAETLANSCYTYMFNSCTSLTQAPELPATTLASSCYYGMFKDCTSLTQAPDLPAETLANYCYYDMFNGCTSLTQAPELPATTLANNCYYNMLNLSNVTSVDMKKSVKGVYISSTHGTLKSGITINYVLD